MSSIYVKNSFFVSWTWTGQSSISIAKSFSIIAMAETQKTLNEGPQRVLEYHSWDERLHDPSPRKPPPQSESGTDDFCWWPKKKHLKNSSQKQIICSGGDFIKNSLKPPTSQDVSHFLAMVPVKMIPPVRWCGSPDRRIIEPVVAMFGWWCHAKVVLGNMMVIVLNARESLATISKWGSIISEVFSSIKWKSPWKHSPVGGCLTIETDWKRNTASASMSYSPKNPNVLFPGLHMTSFSGTSQLALLYRHFWDNPAINFGATWRSVKPPGRRGNEAKVLLAHATAVDAFDIFILALRRSQQMDQGEGSSPWLNEWVVSRVKLCFFVGRIHPQLLGNWGNIRH